MAKPVIIQLYDPNWAVEFEAIKAVLMEVLKDDIVGIEHVGSTSVVGLAAKPVLDIDIIIKENISIFKRVVEQLSQLGYRHVGDLGITGRDAFKRSSSTIPYTASGRTWNKHNLYLCTENSIGLLNHLHLRDYLRQHPAALAAYGKLKQALAQQFPYDMDAYIDGKTDFIVAILNKVGMNKQYTSIIEQENKLTS